MANAAASGAAAALHIIHSAPMQGMGYVQSLNGTGFLDDFAHSVNIYLEDIPDAEQPLLKKDTLPAWKQRIPHSNPAARVETAPDAKTRARLRAKRNR